MTSRERWVQRTREAVMRALAQEQIPCSAAMLEDNLDITEYMPSLGFADRRTKREISAALVWLTKQGYVDVMQYDPTDYDYDDAPGQKVYMIYLGKDERGQATYRFLDDARTFPTPRHPER